MRTRLNSKRGFSPNLSLETLELRRVLAAGTAAIEANQLLICGTDGDDTIIVAELEDRYFVSANFLKGNQFFNKSEVGEIVVDGADGDDTIVATSLNTSAIFLGGAGNDRIFGSPVADHIEANAGDDLVYANGGDDVIFGQAGADTIFAGDGDDFVFAGDGNDIVQGNNGNDVIYGEAGVDTLNGSAGEDIIGGGTGNDLLLGGAGNDQLSGGEGDDTLVGNGDHDELFGENGQDTLLGAGGMDALYGGPDNDRLVGGNGDDDLRGSTGADELFGDSGSDMLRGGADDDLLFGGSGPDILHGNQGNDTLRGGIGNDVLLGYAGNDDLEGGSDRDILVGGLQSNSIDGQGGDDLIIDGTINQFDTETLEAMRTDWTSPVPYENRRSAVLNRVIVEYTCGVGEIAGGTGQDAFVDCNTDDIPDIQPNEVRISERVGAMRDTYDIAIGETFVGTIADSVLANDSAVIDGPLTAQILTLPAHGSIVFNPDGTFTYTQSTHGRDSFTYEVITPGGLRSTGTVTLITDGLPPLFDGVTLTSTDSGLEYYDWEVGTGEVPESSDSVNVSYTGYLPDGTVFDQNTSANFPLSGVIDGFAEGILGMQVGGTRRIIIPPELGYGSNGNPNAGIGGTDTIIFDVQLIAVI